LSAPAPIRHADPDRLLDVSEVADLLGVSPAFVRQHASGLRQPCIPSIKLGKVVRFKRSSVMAFIESMERCS
jgi:excisionase family DNA binding protein